jgi:N-glycosylase/DNA lyase
MMTTGRKDLSDVRAQLREIYGPVRGRIESRLSEFEAVWTSGDEDAMRKELLFCILTPQSKAHACWEAIDSMSCTDVLLHGGYDEVLSAIGNVRFKYKKARFLIETREMFSERGSIIGRIGSSGAPREARNWFAENVKGMGYKEAGHFLRNIGLGRDLAILDRHILRNLVGYGVLKEIPASLSRSQYLRIEDLMEGFSKDIDIPMDHLDLLLWYKEAGSVFK